MRQVGAFGVCLWLAAVACTVGLLASSAGSFSELDLADLGLVFLGCAIITSLAARRCLDVSMIVVAMWGASAGFWGPRWLQLCGSVLTKWEAIAPLPDPLHQPDARLAVSAGAAGVLTAALLYIPTRSSKVVMQTAAAGIAVGAILWMPLIDRWEVELAAIVWNAVVCAGLCSWMVEASRRRESGCCPRCGEEVRGLSSPVCPSCGAALAPSTPQPTLIVAPAAQRPI